MTPFLLELIFEDGLQLFFSQLHDNMSLEEMRATMKLYLRLSALSLSDDQRHSLEKGHNLAMAFFFQSVLSLSSQSYSPSSFGDWFVSVFTSPTDLVLLSVIVSLVCFGVYKKVFSSRDLPVINDGRRNRAPVGGEVQGGEVAANERLV